MRYTEKQAEAKARQIFTRFGELIHDACEGTGVEESFLAGFTGVEAGIDSHGQIKPEAKRFERGVYQDLISLRDHGYCFVGGKKRTTYSGVRRDQIADSSDEAIRALATSYGFSQIMGWHCINNLHCSVADLRDSTKHFHYTVQLLKIVGGEYMEDGDLTAVLHIWNTGSANGKTYHEDYVDNALLVKKHYEEIVATSPSIDSPTAEPQLTALDNPQNPIQSIGAVNTPTAQAEALTLSSGTSKPSDEPIQASQGGATARTAVSIGTIMGAVAAVKGFISENQSEVVIGIICATALILALVFRGVILDWVRMQLHADPCKYNVK